MNEIVYPQDQLKPAHQEVIGRTRWGNVPEFMKYGCSIRPATAQPVAQTVEVKGKRTSRKPAAA